MKTKLILYFFFTFLFSNSISAQVGFGDQNERSCGASDVIKSFLQKNSAFNAIDLQIEERLLEYKKTAQKSSVTQSTIYLPVVVHIIHNNGIENISDARVLAGIQHLNEAYANIGYYNPADGVNTNIQFCMAQRDPNNNPTNGITRNVSAYTNMGGPYYYSDDLNVKDINRWNTSSYINIWLVNSIPGPVAGYAYLPFSHGTNVDGIVQEAAFFGSSYSSDVVIIHEMGHYLGLYHTFEGGCNNSNCLADGDKICDTPPDNSTAFTSCSLPVNSCSTDAQSGFPTDQNDLTQDYMDYGNWDCMTVFTQGQADRMNWIITNVRSSLLSNRSCLPPCPNPVTANFNSSATNISVGTLVNFTNTSVNAVTSKWYIDNVFQTTAANFNFTFNTAGVFHVKLAVAGNNNALCDTSFKETVITVTCPVIANFTASATEALLGSTLNFTNSSSGAVSYNWLVNNVPVSTNTNLAHTFNNPGQYTVTLNAAGSSCTATKTIIVDIFSPCSSTNYFDKTYYNGDYFCKPTDIIELPDSGYVMCGQLFKRNVGEQGFIIRLTKSGNIVWSKLFANTNNTISGGFANVKLLADGNLVVIGKNYRVGNDPTESNGYRSIQIVKMSLGGTVIWEKRYKNDAFHKGSDISFGYRRDNSNIVECADGSLIYAANLKESTVSEGSYKHSVLVGKLDNAGNHLWSKVIIDPIGVTLRSLITEGNHTFLVLKKEGYYNNNASNSPNGSIIMKLNNSDASIVWKNHYRINILLRQLNMQDMVMQNNTLKVYGSFINRVSIISDSLRHFTAFINPADGTMLTNRHTTLHIPSAPSGTSSYLSYAAGAITNSGSFLLTQSPVGNGSVVGALNMQEYDMENNTIFTSKAITYFTGKSIFRTQQISNNDIVILGSMGSVLNTVTGVNIYLYRANRSGTISSNCTTEDLPSHTTTYPIITENYQFGSYNNIVMVNDILSGTIDNGNFSVGSLCAPVTNLSCYNINIYPMPDTICGTADSLVIGARRSSGCSDVVTWNITPSSNGYRVLSDTSIKIKFSAYGNYKIIASLGSCITVADTVNLVVAPAAGSLNIGPDATICNFSIYRINARTGFKSYTWQDGSVDSINTVYSPGKYYVTVKDYCNNVFSDTINFSLAPTPAFDIGPDTTICSVDTLTLTAPAGFSTYTWASNYNINATTGQAVKVWPVKDTVYTVAAVLNNGCSVLDSIKVNVKPAIRIDLGKDTSLCKGDSTYLDAGPGFIGYLWNTGAVSQGIFVKTAGTYFVKATNSNGCTSSDQLIIINIIDTPVNFIGRSIEICSDKKVFIKANGSFYKYLWSTGSNIDSVLITQSGSYWLQVTNSSGCEATEKFTVLGKNCNLAVYFPNSFSPDKNGFNDIFKPGVYGDLEYFHLEIYNSYGQKIFASNDWQKGWDGTFNGSRQNQGAYVWVSIYKLKTAKQETQQGTVLLLR